MMLSDLFHLDKYDLTSPVKNMLDKNHDEITKLEAIASTIGDISDERKEVLQKEIQERQDAIDIKVKEIEAIGVQLVQLELKETQFVELKNLTDLVNSLEVRKDEMNRRRVLLEKYRTAIIHFKNDFDLIDKAKEKVSSLDSSISENEKLKADTEVQLKEVGEKKGKLLEELSSKDEKQKRVELLQKIIEWNELRLSFDKEKGALDLLKSALDKALDQSSVKQIELKALQDRLIVVESELPASDVFVSEVSALKDWKKTLEISSQIENEISNYNNEIVLLTNQLDVLRGNWLEAEYSTFEAVLDKIEKEISSISDKKEGEKIKLGLSAFIAHVNEGQPCPLCGSHDHPSVLHSIGGEELVRIEAEEVAMKSKLGQFNKAVLDAGKIQTSLDSIVKTVSEKQNAKLDAQTACAESAMLFEKKGHLSIEQAEGYLRDIETLFKERESLMQSSTALRNELDQLKLKAEAQRDALTQAEKQVLLIEANIARISKEVESTTEDWWMKYLSMDAASIRNDIAIVVDRINSIDQRFNDANKEFETVQTELSTVTARLDNDRLDLGKSKEELVELNVRFQQNMLSSNFKTEDEILELLKSNLDDKKEQSFIDEFDRDFAVAKNQKSLLEEKLGAETFDAEALTVLRNKVIEEQEFLKQLNGHLGESSASLRILNDGVSQMKQIKSDLGSATSRKMGLKELEGLFKAKGFVSYISNFYLRELCASANVRFNKLTRNQLSLEVDDNNVFYVKDYLNEGKLRLLKTLSGGQTFQASLCLALALAERVKVLNQSDKSFFFLDEGFGSLDRDSLSVVLETLKTLRRENRIVGIISHVEELQQEMDVSLRIELDKERGSLVLTQ
jgi:exonuclease SbcC